MRRRLTRGLLGLLLLPLVGSLRLLFALLRVIARHPEIALLLAATGFVLRVGHPMGVSSEEHLQLAQAEMGSWGSAVAVVLIFAYGATSREMRRFFRRLR